MLIYCRKIKMTKENQVSESEVKRDAKLDSFKNLISHIKQDLVTRLCESAETGAEALVRREEKQLEVRGDFSLPSLTSKTWDRHRLRDNASPSLLLSSNCPLGRKEKEIRLDEESELGCVLRIARVGEAKSGTVTVHLDRASVIKYYVHQAFKERGDGENRTTILASSCDSSSSSSLTGFRVKILTECLNRLPLASEVAVSSTSFPDEVSSIKVKVGPVLGDSGKKEEGQTVEQLKERVRENIDKLDEERRDEREPAEETQERLDRLTNAFLNFALLSSSINNSVKMDMDSQKSHFVMYNKARLTKLLVTFDEQVRRGIYPEVPGNLDDIDFSLLSEPDEWEIVWGHLTMVDEVIEHCSRVLSLHKLVNLLYSLATTYSRYYNRVKILKDPLPTLIPTIHARVVLCRQIDAAFARLLHILGCKTLDMM